MTGFCVEEGMAYYILGVYVQNRVAEATDVQALLTQYGCSIKTRLGLHAVDQQSCSSDGLILLEMFGDSAKINELETSLKALKGVLVQKMVF